MRCAWELITGIKESQIYVFIRLTTCRYVAPYAVLWALLVQEEAMFGPSRTPKLIDTKLGKIDFGLQGRMKDSMGIR